MGISESEGRDLLDSEDLFLKRFSRNFRESLWKKKGWLAAYVFLILAGAFVWCFGQTPYYRATTTLLIDATRIENDEEKRSLNNLALQEALIRSPEVVDQVLEKTKLLTTPLFDESENPTEVFLKLLEVELDPKSKTIDISFLYINPDEAARVANEIAQTYIYSKATKSSGMSIESIEKLKEQTQQEMKRLNEIKSKIAELNKAYPDLGSEDMVDEQIRSLNAQFIEMDSKLLQLKATLFEIDGLLKQGGSVDNHPFIRTHPRVSQTLERIRAAELESLELQQEYRGMHPLVVKVQMKLTALKKTVEEEKAQIVEDLREEAKSREASRQQIQKTMIELQTKKKELTPQKLAYKNLLTEEATATETVRLLNAQISKASVAASMRNAGIEVLKMASPPVSPYKPNKPKALFMAFVFALASSVGPIFLACYMDRTLKRVEDVEQMTQKPFLGQIPFVRIASGRVTPQFRDEKGKIYFENALRLASANINFLINSNDPTAMMITGSRPAEGKSFFAYHLARTFAGEGKKTVLIDADFCRSTISMAFPQKSEERPGLHHYLMESAEADAIIEATAEENLSFIPSRESQFSAPHALRSERMKSLLRTLKEQFDIIIFDAPPILAVNDAIALGEIVDIRVLVIEWGKTPKDDVLRALTKIAPSNLVTAAVILNKVKHLEQGYYYGNYSGSKKGKKRDGGKITIKKPGEKDFSEEENSSGAAPVQGS